MAALNREARNLALQAGAALLRMESNLERGSDEAAEVEFEEAWQLMRRAKVAQLQDQVEALGLGSDWRRSA